MNLIMKNTIQSTAYDAIEEIINQKILMFYKLFVFVPNREIKKAISADRKYTKCLCY